jgi:DNA-binding CsgD family transcriptional regulator
MAIVDASNDPVGSLNRKDHRLTVQEQEILARSASGWSIAAVADGLGLAPEAVQRSLDSIIMRVAARSRIEAVMIVVRQGLINLPTDPVQAGALTGGQWASVARSVTRLRSWSKTSQRTAAGPLTLADTRRRVNEVRRDQIAAVDGAAT